MVHDKEATVCPDVDIHANVKALEQRYDDEALTLSKKMDSAYPLVAEHVDEYMIEHYEDVEPVLNLRRKIEECVLTQLLPSLSKEDTNFYSVFDAKLHGPFESKQAAFDCVEKNASRHPMQPITFQPFSLAVKLPSIL